MHYSSAWVEYPESMLGCLSPSGVSPPAESLINSTAIVNSIALPQRVIDELRRQGIALSWYNTGELEDAVIACAFDGQLIDDPDGINFRDKLILLDNEHKHSRSQNLFHKLPGSHLERHSPEWDELDSDDTLFDKYIQ